jgi:ATP-dependent Clp protease ATP-binding subunit ClpC
VRILEGLRDRYESFHNVQYSPDAIEAAVLQSNRYLPDRFLPDKAIDVIDEAGARVKLRAQQEPGYLPPRLRLEARERGGLDAARERGGLDAARERGGLDAARERGGLDAARERGGLDAARERGSFDTTRERSDRQDSLRDRSGYDAGRERGGYDAGRDRGNYSSLTRRQAFNEALELEYQEPMPIVTKEDIDDVIARWTGIPVASLREEELVKLLRIEEELHKRVISQDSGISALARAIRRSRAGLRNPQRPVGSFLFLGPTGVGKTEVARTLAEFLFGSERSMIRFDMSEFMEKHSVSKLIGSPPGYVGHEEGGQMTERVRRNPYSVLLLDEIEKAHPDVFNILLQVLEDGLLTDSLGNTVDFRHVIIILTSNIGARFIYKRGYLGFQSSENSALAHTEDRVMSAVRDTFNPEFINRLDEIIVFEPLSDEDLLRIVNLLIGRMNQTLGQRGLEVRLTPEAAQWIVDKTCTDRSYGARPLRRALQKHVEDPLSEAIIQGHIGETPIIEVYLDADHLNYRPLLTAESDMPDELLVSQD